MPCAGIYGSLQHLCLCPTNKICVVLTAEAAGCVSILWPDVLSRHLDCSLFGSSACATNVIVDLVCRCHYYSCLQCFDTIGWASEGHPVCKKLSGEVICLGRDADLHICHCHSLSFASVKSRLVLPCWYQLTWVVPDKGPLNRGVCVVTTTD